MPTKNPRINVVIEPEIYTILIKLAEGQGLSLSLLSRDLIKEALEIREDIYWEKEAKNREKTFVLKKSLSHEDVWR